MHKSTKVLASTLLTAVVFVTCGFSSTKASEKEKVFVSRPPVVVHLNHQIDEPAVEIDQFTDEEVIAITTTLAGECYDDKIEDKRLVVEVILNRVSDGRFGDGVLDVVSAKSQFDGYWTQSRPISENDIQVAEDALREWYDNDCEPLSDYLFFCAGSNRENVFRVSYN